MPNIKGDPMTNNKKQYKFRNCDIESEILMSDDFTFRVDSSIRIWNIWCV